MQSDQPFDRVATIKVALSNGVQVVIKGEAIDLDGAIASLAEAQKEARKAREQGLDAKTFQAVMRDRSKVAG
jgi:malonyl CoA-acyl carrier protein transacylase